MTILTERVCIKLRTIQESLGQRQTKKNRVVESIKKRVDTIYKIY